jgi:hypothetical protein
MCSDRCSPVWCSAYLDLAVDVDSFEAAWVVQVWRGVLAMFVVMAAHTCKIWPAVYPYATHTHISACNFTFFFACPVCISCVIELAWSQTPPACAAALVTPRPRVADSVHAPLLLHDMGRLAGPRWRCGGQDDIDPTRWSRRQLPDVD